MRKRILLAAHNDFDSLACAPLCDPSGKDCIVFVVQFKCSGFLLFTRVKFLVKHFLRGYLFVEEVRGVMGFSFSELRQSVN